MSGWWSSEARSQPRLRRILAPDPAPRHVTWCAVIAHAYQCCTDIYWSDRAGRFTFGAIAGPLRTLRSS